MRNSAITRGLIAIIASAAFLWALTLSVSPQLHARIHTDANAVGHACAVTMIASGKVDHTSSALLISAPAHLDEFGIPKLTPQWVASVFRVASVFEHAPPANS